MKRPDCSKNHRKNDGMTCSCGYGFVFNPSTNQATGDYDWGRILNIKYSKRIGQKRDRILNTQSQYLIFKMRPHCVLSGSYRSHNLKNNGVTIQMPW